MPLVLVKDKQNQKRIKKIAALHIKFLAFTFNFSVGSRSSVHRQEMSRMRPDLFVTVAANEPFTFQRNFRNIPKIMSSD
jgi:hypothetical protein